LQSEYHQRILKFENINLDELEERVIEMGGMFNLIEKKTCKICHLKFNDIELIDHLKSHENELQFECNICQKSFISNEKLENH